MLNFQAMELMHRHDDGKAAPMTEVAHPSVQDEERDWLHGGRIFRCTECNEEVVVGSPQSPRDEPGAPD
jgi:hypothetical protein